MHQSSPVLKVFVDTARNEEAFEMAFNIEKLPLFETAPTCHMNRVSPTFVCYKTSSPNAHNEILGKINQIACTSQ